MTHVQSLHLCRHCISLSSTFSSPLTLSLLLSLKPTNKHHPGVSELEPDLLAKARKLALGVGAAAGAFGGLVGVGGGVLIGPVILNTCP